MTAVRSLAPAGTTRRGPLLVALLISVALVVGCAGPRGTSGPSAATAGSASSAASGAGGSVGTTASSTPDTAPRGYAGAPASLAPLPSLSPAQAAQDALGLQRRFVDVVKVVSPSVVVIATDRGLGSGVVYDTKGDIVTNAHVTDGATSFQVTLADGRTRPGALVGSFPPDDLAVVRVSGDGLHPATFGSSAGLDVGDIVMAIGNPLGLQSSVTEGIVSAVGRTVTEPGGATLTGLIQTSAQINPGNSGGALVDLDGRVVGIPTLAATDPQIGGAAAGIGFAIPSDTAKDIAGQLVQYGRVVTSHRAYLGVGTSDTLGGSGVLVNSVVADGPAARAGIQPGDLITTIAGQPVPDTSTLSQVLAGLKPGEAVKVELERGQTSMSVQVTLGQYPG